jgi:hypothetical protein
LAACTLTACFFAPVLLIGCAAWCGAGFFFAGLCDLWAEATAFFFGFASAAGRQNVVSNPARSNPQISPRPAHDVPFRLAKHGNMVDALFRTRVQQNRQKGPTQEGRPIPTQAP